MQNLSYLVLDVCVCVCVCVYVCVNNRTGRRKANRKRSTYVGFISGGDDDGDDDDIHVVMTIQSSITACSYCMTRTLALTLTRNSLLLI